MLAKSSTEKLLKSNERFNSKSAEEEHFYHKYLAIMGSITMRKVCQNCRRGDSITVIQFCMIMYQTRQSL